MKAEPSPWKLTPQELAFQPPGYWFYMKALPQEMREFLHPYRLQVMEENRQLEPGTPDEAEILAATMGTILARAESVALRRLAGEANLAPKEEARLEAGVWWIQEKMDRRILPGPYQKIFQYYRKSRSDMIVAHEFWQSLPHEIQEAVLKFFATEDPFTELPDRPPVLALALARAQVIHWHHATAAKVHKHPSQPTAASEGYSQRITDWIRRRLEAHFYESRDSWEAATGQRPYLRELLHLYSQALGRTTQTHVLESLETLNPKIVEVLWEGQRVRKREIEKDLPPLSKGTVELRAWGRTVGHYLGSVYTGLANFAFRHQLFQPEDFGIRPSLVSWERRLQLSDRELEEFMQTLEDNPRVIQPYQDLALWTLEIKKDFGSAHPFIVGFEETFRLGPQEMEYPDGTGHLEQLKLGVHRVEHHPEYEFLAQLPPWVGPLVMGNLQRVGPPYVHSFPFALARSLALTLAQSQSRRVRLNEGGLYPVMLPLVQPESAKAIQDWYRPTMARMRRDPRLQELYHLLGFEIAELSEREIKSGIVKLGSQLPPWVWRHHESLSRRHEEFKSPVGDLYVLGKTLGFYLRRSYSEILRIGAEAGLPIPRDLGINPGDFIKASDAKGSTLHPEEVWNAGMVHYYMEEVLQRWGIHPNPFGEGFGEEYFKEGLEGMSLHRMIPTLEQVARYLTAKKAPH